MTHFLIEGLKGEALDKQGEYTWGDLTNYVKKSVIRNQGKLAGGADRLQNPHSINSNSDVIVLGRIGKVPTDTDNHRRQNKLAISQNDPNKPGSSSSVIPPLSAPFGEQEIASAIGALGRSKGMKPTIKNDIGMEFRLIPAGKFKMGSPESEGERSGDEYQHEVEIRDAFYMGTYEATQSQWKRVMGENPSKFSSSGVYTNSVKGMRTSNFPVDNVSWEDAQKFTKRLNSEFLVPGYRYRLPTEAEWEYACRGGSETVFNFGDVLTGKSANCNGNSPYGSAKEGPYLRRTTKVGSYLPNVFSLHDMHGNVWEWCSDWYDEHYYLTTPPRDPSGPSTGTFRVLRGGSWNDGAANCRSASRDYNGPSNPHSDRGFRVLLAR